MGRRGGGGGAAPTHSRGRTGAPLQSLPQEGVRPWKHSQPCTRMNGGRDRQSNVEHLHAAPPSRSTSGSSSSTESQCIRKLTLRRWAGRPLGALPCHEDRACLRQPVQTAQPASARKTEPGCSSPAAGRPGGRSAQCLGRPPSQASARRYTAPARGRGQGGVGSTSAARSGPCPSHPRSRTPWMQARAPGQCWRVPPTWQGASTRCRLRRAAGHAWPQAAAAAAGLLSPAPGCPSC